MIIGRRSVIHYRALTCVWRSLLGRGHVLLLLRVSSAVLLIIHILLLSLYIWVITHGVSPSLLML